MFEIEFSHTRPLCKTRRVVEVGVPFGSANNEQGINVRINHFFVAPDAAVVRCIQCTEPLVKGFAGDSSAQSVEIVLHIKQSTTGFTGVNDLVGWVLPSTIHAL